MSNLVHRRRRCARIVIYTILCLEGSTPQDRCLSMFIALRWMQEPRGVMMWLPENIQACLRIFWQPQHQWLARDILHLPKGVFTVFVLWHTGPIRSIRLIRGRKREEFIGKDEQAINHLHFHTFCIKMAAARQKTSKLAFLHSPCTLFPQNPYTIQINALSLHS